MRPLILLLVLAALITSLLWAQSDTVVPAMAGISNHGRNPDQPYVTSGDRAYLIGTQDGDFPDLGEHIPGEMGGLWVHPIKLIDGFWATVTDRVSHRRVALSHSNEFVAYPYGSRFRYGAVLDGLEIDRFQFSPDGEEGLVVQYQLRNPSARTRQLDLALAVKTDLRPVWYSERLGIKDARDAAQWRAADRLFVAKDGGNPWFCVWGVPRSPDAHPVAHPPPIHTRGTGATTAAEYRISVAPHETSTLTIVFAGSATDLNRALDTYHDLGSHWADLLRKQQERYAALVERARVKIPDPRLQEVYDWVRINAEWLVREVPGIGRGLAGGFMEYPWWFGTETYSLQALMETGDFEVVRQTLRLLQRQSAKANGNGRIVHEVTTNGGISNLGNTQETAQFILTAARLLDWSGDLAFAREMYPAMKQGIHWLLTDMDRNHDLFPEGYGIMEVYGLNAELIDVAVYTQQALRGTARVARVLDDTVAAREYEHLGSELATRINDRFWVDADTSYADFYGTRAQAISAAQGAIKQIGLKRDGKLSQHDRELIGYYEKLGRAFAAMPDETRGWITNKNWVVTTPMEAGIAPRARAIEALDRIRRDNVGAHGPFLSAVNRGAMMTISTGVQAVSEANYGRTDNALWYVDRIVETFNLRSPGAISEMMPDYGCFVIAWTAYGIIVPLIQHVFGIQPDAIHQTVVIEPHLPTGWHELSIEDLPIGTNRISFSRARTERGIEYTLEAKDDGWTFILKPVEPSGATYYLNGTPTPVDSAGIHLTGRTNRVLVVTKH